MKTLELLIGLLIITEFAAMVVAGVLIAKLRELNEIERHWRRSRGVEIDIYNCIKQQQDKIVEANSSIFTVLNKQYDIVAEINKRYDIIKEIIASKEDARLEALKTAAERYSDSYEQFKLCSEKLDKIFMPPACGCCGTESCDDAKDGGQPDD